MTAHTHSFVVYTILAAGAAAPAPTGFRSAPSAQVNPSGFLFHYLSFKEKKLKKLDLIN